MKCIEVALICMRWVTLISCDYWQIFDNCMPEKSPVYKYGAAVLTTHFTRLDVCQWCWGSANHSPWSSVISPYSVYVVSEILFTVMKQATVSNRYAFPVSFWIWIHALGTPPNSSLPHALQCHHPSRCFTVDIVRCQFCRHRPTLLCIGL